MKRTTLMPIVTPVAVDRFLFESVFPVAIENLNPRACRMASRREANDTP